MRTIQWRIFSLAKRAPKNAAERYASDVLAGRIVVGKRVHQAVERHTQDLQTGRQRGFRFDPAAGMRILTFFTLLRHSKGEWAGQPFLLSPWQAFVLWVLFGWRRSDGTRRFRTAYIEIGRKNGKSTLAAGVGLYLFAADKEPGAQVFTAATKRDQARIVHGEAINMVRLSTGLRRHVQVFKDNLSMIRTNSKYEPLGADADTMDGLNVHGAIIDELHAHKNRNLWDVLETATGSRRQPLIFAITTAGFDKKSICWQQHDYGEKVLDGIIPDDSYFAFIAALDAEDEWANRNVWIKANPNLGVSVKPESLEEQCLKAESLPAAQNAFRRLRLNQWTEQADRWIDIPAWDACALPVDATSLKGRECFGGLDLSSTTDLSAFVLVFPPKADEERWQVLCRFWMPSDNVRRRVERDRVPYDQWIREGYIEATNGNVIDYEVLRKRISEDAQQYDIHEIAFDRWNATQLCTQLQDDGLTMIPFGQGFASMSAPTKEMEKMIIGKQLAHGGHPVLRWMISNVSVKQDPAGNLKPDKAKSTERIDGVVSLIMGIGRAMVRPEPQYADYQLFFIT
jgi:phage terminase large subunit-like protein